MSSIQSPQLARLGRNHANQILNDPNWTKAVFLRDPLTRLLSAYLDKFVASPQLGIHGDYGVRLFGSAISFAEFARRVASNNTDRKLADGLHLGTNAHWKPQRFTCSLEKFAHVFNFVGRYENIREHVESLLRSLGLWDTYGAQGWAPRVFSGNGTRPPRDAIFARAAAHKTNAAERYAEYYAPSGLEATMRRAYKMDYDIIDALGALPDRPPTTGFAWGRYRQRRRHRRLCDLDPEAFGNYCAPDWSGTRKRRPP